MEGFVEKTNDRLHDLERKAEENGEKLDKLFALAVASDLKANGYVGLMVQVTNINPTHATNNHYWSAGVIAEERAYKGEKLYKVRFDDGETEEYTLNDFTLLGERKF